MSNLAQETNTPKFKSSETTTNNNIYVKTKPLSDEQIEKGYYEELTAGSSIEGILLSTQVDSKYGKNQYTIQSFDGLKTRVLTASGNLDARVKNEGIKVGDPVQVVYNGTKEMKSGKYKGTDAHNWTVNAAE